MKKHCYSRSDIFRMYKVMCKKLGVDYIYFGKICKKDAEACIYGETYDGSRHPVMWWRDLRHYCRMTIDDENAKKGDVQKAIVLRVMKALETGDVSLNVQVFYRNSSDYPTIPKGICWEEELIKMDLEYH